MSKPQTSHKSYSECIALESFSERLNYLKVYGQNPSNENRGLMNDFYKSNAWLSIRDTVIQRDLGQDLGVQNLFIEDGPILVHHIVPITIDDVIKGSPFLFDLENLITVSLNTHNTIHYSKEKTIMYIERRPGDTMLW